MTTKENQKINSKVLAHSRKTNEPTVVQKIENNRIYYKVGFGYILSVPTNEQELTDKENQTSFSPIKLPNVENLKDYKHYEIKRIGSKDSYVNDELTDDFDRAYTDLLINACSHGYELKTFEEAGNVNLVVVSDNIVIGIIPSQDKLMANKEEHKLEMSDGGEDY